VTAAALALEVLALRARRRAALAHLERHA